MRFNINKLAGIGFFAGLFATAAFGQQTIPTYSITNELSTPIYDISLWWRAPQQGYGPGSLWGSSGLGFEAAANSTTSLSDLTKPVPPTGELLLGLVTDPSVGDEPGQTHAVVFMNSATASAVANIAFGTVFPNTNETQLISDIEAQTAANNGSAVNDLFNFVGGDADHIPSGTSPTGSITSWITPNAVAVPATGSIMEWSNGTQIGTFTATNAAVTPTPASFLCFGVGIVGFFFRKRKRTLA
jgi:hypothetical protein